MKCFLFILLAVSVAAQTNLLPPPPKLPTNLLARATNFVQVPTTNLIITASILTVYQIQWSADLSNWTVLTNVWFAPVSVTVANNGSNLYFRGCWPANANVGITTNNSSTNAP
jgi:hypothetical protein